MRQQARPDGNVMKEFGDSPSSSPQTPAPVCARPAFAELGCTAEIVVQGMPSGWSTNSEDSADHCLATKREGEGGQKERQAAEKPRHDRLPPGLFLVMQPIMSMTEPTGSLNFEVLLRVRAPDGSVQPAAKAIATAEKSGNISAIDRWVVATVLEWVTKHQACLTHTRFICVNLSGRSINDEQFREDILALFARFKDIVPYLCLEITESVALRNMRNAQRFISRVHDMGGKIALDDFGSGYSSFKYLRNLSADALKIDGEFIRSMCAHPADIAIVSAIVALARNLGMRSIAEWVENIHTLRVLKEIGVDYVQGFLVARPQEATAILTASSAASFVQDPATVQFIRGIGNAGPEPGSGFPVMDRTKLH